MTVVDASAIVSIVFGENDAETFSRAFVRHRGALSISPVNLWEAAAKAVRSKAVAQRTAFEQLERTIDWTIVPVSAEQGTIAREAWMRYGRGSGHRAKLNFGDCFAYALAKTLDEPLLFKGDDFTHTDVRSAL